MGIEASTRSERRVAELTVRKRKLRREVKERVDPKRIAGRRAKEIARIMESCPDGATVKYLAQRTGLSRDKLSPAIRALLKQDLLVMTGGRKEPIVRLQMRFVHRPGVPTSGK